MLDKDIKVLSYAKKAALAKTLKILELGLSDNLSEDEVDAKIIERCEAKVALQGGKVNDYISGQRWYVEDLIKFSKLDGQARIDHEYDNAFAAIANEDQVANLIDQLIAGK